MKPNSLTGSRRVRRATRITVSCLIVCCIVAACSSARGGGSRATARRTKRPPSTTTTNPRPTTTAAAPTRDAAQWPFAATSPWNMPLGSNARYEDGSAACSSSLVLSDATATINAEQWSIGISQATSTDPPVAISRSGVPQITTPVPVGAAPAQPPASAGGDANLDIISPDHHFVDELWQARRVNGGWNATAYWRNDLTGSGVGDGGVRAYGGSSLGGLMRTAELAAHKIPHALALALTLDQLKRGFVWPAAAEDSTDAAQSYRGDVPIGTLVAIPPSVDLGTLHLTPEGLAIATALQDYGAYVVDASSTDALYAEPSAEPLIASARHEMERVLGSLRCVPNNGPTTVGGGGEPRAPLAPAFAE